MTPHVEVFQLCFIQTTLVFAMMAQMALCKASRCIVAAYLLSLLGNCDCPTGRFWEVILKTGAYGESVAASWHGPYLEKLTLCQGL